MTGNEPSKPMFFGGEIRFVWGLATALGVVALGFWSYGLYEKYGVQQPADDLLAAPSPTAEQVREAFELLRSPHLFAHYTTPDRLWPADDRVLSGSDEKRLREALANRAPAILAGITLDGRDHVALARDLANPSDDQARERARRTRESHGDFARTVALRGTGFATHGLEESDASFCREYPPCVAWYLRDRHPGLYYYVRAADAALGGRDYEPGVLAGLRRHPSHWIRLFDERRMAPGGSEPTPGDVTMLRDLLAVHANATGNGFVFSAYLTLGALLMAFTAIAARLLSRRRARSAPIADA